MYSDALKRHVCTCILSLFLFNFMHQIGCRGVSSVEFCELFKSWKLFDWRRSALVAVLVQVRVGVCEWLAWLLRMRREPEVDLVTTSHRRSSLIRRQSMRNDDIASRYSIRAGGHHLANEIGTNGNSSGSRDDWLASRRSTSLCRRGSIRSAQRRNTSRVELENDSSQWRSIQTIPAGGELEQDERSRSNTCLLYTSDAADE